MTVLLDDDSVRAVLDPVALVDTIEAAIRAEVEQASVVPERMNLDSGGRFLRVMPAVIPNAGVMGLKTFFGGDGVGVRYLVVLISIETGEVLAAIDACYLTAARTAATSAVAARAMGVKAAAIGVLGSGLEAETHVRTFAALGGVERVQVFSPTPATRERFATRLTDELGLDVVPCTSAAQACAEVEHLITATNTGYGGPIACESGWVPAGIHLSAIGSTHRDLRELQTDILRRADLLVFDADPAQIAAESGDVRQLVDEGADLANVVRLEALVQGVSTPPADPQDLTIFKSVGTAMQDLVAADVAFRCAVEADVGDDWDRMALPKARR